MIIIKKWKYDSFYRPVNRKRGALYSYLLKCKVRWRPEEDRKTLLLATSVRVSKRQVSAGWQHVGYGGGVTCRGGREKYYFKRIDLRSISVKQVMPIYINHSRPPVPDGIHLIFNDFIFGGGEKPGLFLDVEILSWQRIIVQEVIRRISNVTTVCSVS